LIASAVPGVDTVTNANALSGGMDAESDAAFRLRFQSFIDSRTRATLQAITYAARSVQQNITCTVKENSDASGNYLPGHFIVTVDDGSGAPPASLLASVQTAVNAVRPIGSTFAVQEPSLIAANISLTLTLASGANSGTVIAAVNSAIMNFVNTLPVGTALPYTRLAQLAYDASPSVLNVNALTLQGGSADLSAVANAVIRIGTLTIN
jgi:phage-related baseplate assembly protein